jgi:hypothetical protein
MLKLEERLGFVPIVVQERAVEESSRQSSGVPIDFIDIEQSFIVEVQLGEGLQMRDDVDERELPPPVQDCLNCEVAEYVFAVEGIPNGS